MFLRYIVRPLCFLLILMSSFALLQCGTSPAPPSTLRLTSSHQAQVVEGKSAAVRNVQRTEWRFDGKQELGWTQVQGIQDLTAKTGLLTGTTTTETPLLHLERKTGLDDEDTLHSIEIRMRSSAGTNLGVMFSDSEKFETEKTLGLIRDFPSFVDQSPLVAGDHLNLYTLRTRQPHTASQLRHIVILPSDQKGARFEIESIRLIFRKEYLAGIPSGVSWQPLKGIYHETIVARTPEVHRQSLVLPTKPWLDMSIGTIEDGPLTFQVSLQRNSGSREEVLMERTITRGHRWEPAGIDLPSNLAGQKVQLSFSLKAETEGKIGFWGSPVIRSRRTLTTAVASESAKPAQNVILVWTDTLRRDHLEPYGYERPTSPNLKRIAEQGALFRDCVSQATWTKVASPSLITSLYPATHGVREFTDRLPSSATTLTEIFQNAGYATVGFSSNLFTATFSNFHQGFEELHEDSSLPDPDSSKTTREYMDRLLPWLDQHKDVPFFVFFHSYDVHDPYEPYAPFNTMWADPSKKEEHEKQLADARKVIADPLMKAFGMPNREEMVKAGFDPDAYVAYDKDWYDGSIRAMDTEMGRLFEYLQNHKLDQNTLVVLVGDHGEEFLEHGRMFHGQTVYGELTNVPLMMWGPGIVPSKRVIDETVETVDVMPTILELSGLKAPAGIQGQSLASWLRLDSHGSVAEAHTATQNATGRSNPAFSEKAITKDSAAPAPHDTESFSVVSDGWKLIHNTQRPAGSPEYELYNERQDPLNHQNVATQHEDVVLRLAKLLQQWRTAATAAKLKPDAEAAKGLSQEELERLRSLGYIQ